MYEKILNMDIMTKPFKTGQQVLRAPTVYSKKYEHHDQNYVAVDEKSANLFYGTRNPNVIDGKCAMWLEPYRNMLLNRPLDIWAKGDNEMEASSKGINKRLDELIARVMHATVRPSAVRAAAAEFHHLIMKKKTYVAMHWRYDEGDYGVHCKKIGDKGICGALQRMDPEQVGKRLAAAIKNKLADKDVPLKDAFIYIAAPSKETEAVEKMRKSLKKDKISVYYGDNLQNFLEKRH